MIRSLQRPIVRSLVRPLIRHVGTAPVITTIAALGDSLSSGISVAANNPNESSYLWPVFAQTDRRITPVLSSAGGNFQTGGLGAAAIRDAWLSEVIAASPSACVVMVGTNDLATASGAFRPDLDAAAASVFAIIAEIATALKTAGITPILCTITPDNFPTVETWPPGTGNYHPDYRTTRKKINDLIRVNARSLGAVLCDWAGVISLDPNDDTALADVRYLFDNVHFYDSGNQQLGDFLRRVIVANFNLAGQPFALPASDSPSWVLPNPYMTGDVSGKATGWDVLATGATVTPSKTADGWQRMVCTDGADPGTLTNNFRLTRFISATDNSLDGRTYRGVVEFYPQQSGFEIWHAYVNAACSNTSDAGILRQARSPSVPATSGLVEIGGYWTWADKFLLLTPPVTHLGGTGTQQRRVTLTAQFFGRGTVDVRVCGVIDVTT
jgi:lysophospholipase L1-like esterase